MSEHERTGQQKQDKVDQKHRVMQKESQPLFGRFHAWEQGTVATTETPFLPRMDEHAELLSRAPSGEHRASLVLHLQQTYGNRYVQRLLNSRAVQAKLTVSSPSDVYEQEADRVAKAVTGTVNAQVQRQPEEEEELQMKVSQVQRQEEEEEEEEVQTKASQVQRQEEEEEEEEVQTKASQVQRQEEEEEEEIQAKPSRTQPATVSENLEMRIKAARGGGHPLSDTVRKPMEGAFGADFSGVRVHTDSEADTLNRQLSAKAFTTGQDVFFREGKYSPGSDSGRELIAHELTHVVQQSTGKVGSGGSGMTVRPVSDAFEQEADNLARHVVNRLRAPDLTHVAQTSRYATPIRVARSGQIQRWAEGEHEQMGNLAWNTCKQIVEKMLGKSTPFELPKLEQVGPLTYGKLTQLGGDYARTVEELRNVKHTWTPTAGITGATDWIFYHTGSFNSIEKERSANYKKMLKIAATNVDHFSPTAQIQYQKQHQIAINKAELAALAAKEWGRVKGEEKAPLSDALLNEGFAAHFLQDSYASGHQCPRGLDTISEGESRWGATLGSLGTKSYHDMLCKVAVPIAGPAAGYYHGDFKAESTEITRLGDETGRSLFDVLVAYWGPDLGPAGQSKGPSYGPDIGKFDKKLSKVWKKMTGGYRAQAKRVEKHERRREKKGRPEEALFMPGTGTKYTRQQILKYYQYIRKKITYDEYMKFLKGSPPGVPGGGPGRKWVPGRYLHKPIGPV